MVTGAHQANKFTSDWSQCQLCYKSQEIQLLRSGKSLEMWICLWPEFDCPEVTLCGWQDIKIWLLLLLPTPNTSNYCLQPASDKSVCACSECACMHMHIWWGVEQMLMTFCMLMLCFDVVLAWLWNVCAEGFHGRTPLWLLLLNLVLAL